MSVDDVPEVEDQFVGRLADTLMPSVGEAQDLLILDVLVSAGTGLGEGERVAAGAGLESSTHTAYLPSMTLAGAILQPQTQWGVVDLHAYDSQ